MEPDSFPNAASCGDVGLVRRLIEAGENVNAANADGATALHLAISSGTSSDTISEIVRALLEAGASVHTQNNEEHTALHVAAANGHVESVEMLIRAGADVNAETDSTHVTPLFLAIRNDQPDNNCSEVIRLLIEAGASLDQRDAYDFSHLRKAVALGKVNAVRQLILSGADVNEVNNAGKSILLAAARSQRNDQDASQILQLLLDAGALPNVPDPRGFTPLHAAATLGKARRVDQLIKAGADVNAIDQSRFVTILHSVISSVESDGDRFEVVRLLLEAGISLDRRDSLHYDALLLAAAVEKATTVKQLILAGAYVRSIYPNTGESCLHLVTKWQGKSEERFAIIRLLLQVGADINACDYALRTPLHHAAGLGDVQMFKWLTEAGANIDESVLLSAVLPTKYSKGQSEIVRLSLKANVTVESLNIHGKTLLLRAIERGSIEIIEQLTSARADVQASDENGDTCLHTAVINAEKYVTNFFQIVRVLSEAGAPLNLCNKQGQTPLHIAVSQGYVEWVDSLIKVGVDVNAENQDHRTSLHVAIELEEANKRFKIIRLLTQAGASVTKPTNPTPINSAVTCGKLSIIELEDLIQAYANEHPDCEVSRELESIGTHEDTTSYRLKVIRLLLKAADGEERFTPLHYAVKTGDVALVELIIKEGDDVNATTSSQETSLHLALRSNLEITICRQIVQLLLKADASVNSSNTRGLTPLVSALKLFDEELVQQLISAGADSNIITSEGSSCLHQAILNSNRRNPSKLISMLIEAGAPVNIIDETHHRTPLHYAVLSGYDDAVKKLIRAGADVNLADHNGITCLHLVPESNGYANSVLCGFNVYFGPHAIIRLLLKAGANPDARDRDGVTPLMNAAHNGDSLFVEQLIKSGADVNLTNTRDNCTALGLVCKRLEASSGSVGVVVSLLVAAGAEVTRPIDDPLDLWLNRRQPGAPHARPRDIYDHYSDCRGELQLMRETIFHDSTTYYQILRSNKLVRYAKNQSIIEKFERGEITALFPIYGGYLEQSFRKAQQRRDLMDQASTGLRRILGLYYGLVPSLVHDRILDYLDDDDLLYLHSV